MHTMYKCKFHCTVSKRTLYEHEQFYEYCRDYYKEYDKSCILFKNVL